MAGGLAGCSFGGQPEPAPPKVTPPTATFTPTPMQYGGVYSGNIAYQGVNLPMTVTIAQSGASISGVIGVQDPSNPGAAPQFGAFTGTCDASGNLTLHGG